MLAAPLVIGLRPDVRNAAAFVPLLATLVVWLCVPFMFLHTAHIYQRFGVFLLPSYALMFGTARPVAMGPVRRLVAVLWLPALCWVFLAVHVERVTAFARESAPFEDMLAAAKPGYRALGLILDPASAASGNLGGLRAFPVCTRRRRAASSISMWPARRPWSCASSSIGRRQCRPPTDGMRAISTGSTTVAEATVTSSSGTLPSSETFFPSGRCRPVLRKSVGAWSLFENVDCYDAAAAGQASSGGG